MIKHKVNQEGNKVGGKSSNVLDRVCVSHKRVIPCKIACLQVELKHLWPRAGWDGVFFRHSGRMLNHSPGYCGQHRSLWSHQPCHLAPSQSIGEKAEYVARGNSRIEEEIQELTKRRISSLHDTRHTNVTVGSTNGTVLSPAFASTSTKWQHSEFWSQGAEKGEAIESSATCWVCS